MKLAELAILYGLVGVGCSLAVAARTEQWRVRALNTALLTLFWPLIGPFLLMRPEVSAPAGGHETSFLDALARAEGTPLACLLPDRAAARSLAGRLDIASARVEEINRLLEQPAFSAEAAESRHRELAAAGDETAAATALSRAQNIGRLRQLRDQYARELDVVRELTVQLRIQAEVVRLLGEADDGTRDLVIELVSRVEGIDAMLDDGRGDGDL